MKAQGSDRSKAKQIEHNPTYELCTRVMGTRRWPFFSTSRSSKGLLWLLMPSTQCMLLSGPRSGLDKRTPLTLPTRFGFNLTRRGGPGVAGCRKLVASEPQSHGGRGLSCAPGGVFAQCGWASTAECWASGQRGEALSGLWTQTRARARARARAHQMGCVLPDQAPSPSPVLRWHLKREVNTVAWW